MEELRAELASAFIAGHLGIPTDIPQLASYIAHWIKSLKEDKREIFRAAADAQKITDMLLGFHPRICGEAAGRAGAPCPNAAVRRTQTTQTWVNCFHPQARHGHPNLSIIKSRCRGGRIWPLGRHECRGSLNYVAAHLLK